MTKTCKVIYRNEKVAVVCFDKTEVQIPAVDGDVIEVKLRKDGDSFYVVDNNETENKETTENKVDTDDA